MLRSRGPERYSSTRFDILCRVKARSNFLGGIHLPEDARALFRFSFFLLGGYFFLFLSRAFSPSIFFFVSSPSRAQLGSMLRLSRAKFRFRKIRYCATRALIIVTRDESTHAALFNVYILKQLARHFLQGQFKDIFSFTRLIKQICFAILFFLIGYKIILQILIFLFASLVSFPFNLFFQFF